MVFVSSKLSEERYPFELTLMPKAYRISILNDSVGMLVAKVYRKNNPRFAIPFTLHGKNHSFHVLWNTSGI
ncbi:MAG: hypothetical protein HC903_08390 [Methylacidiphilales bacterium]|nr:hypothetical protein [Candidatus Methylacidiphilales bacterium]NJR17736.1 hypothetical protein [Calothrix sp. CSU_2_0]